MRHAMNKTLRMRRTRRGSALLLVVGLLTILAMLGTTFLLVTRLNRKTTDALLSVKLDTYADAIANQLALKVKEDLHINASGAYGDANSPLEFVDALSRDSGGDDWLASHYKKSDGIWYQVTDITSQSMTFRNVSPTGLQDTDKDDLGDSHFTNTGLFNPVGNYLYAGVRIIDLSGLINLNVATEPTQYPDLADTNYWPAYISPVMIDLYSLIGQGVYDRLNTARANGSGITPRAINNNIGLRQADPLNSAEPFGLGNEWYCRYLAESATIRVGELYNATQVNGAPLPVSAVRYMTTKSISRSILRQHTANIDQPLPFWTVDASGIETNNANVLDNATVRGELVTLLSGMISPDGEKRAAHYVANLWAYLDGQDPAKAYKVVSGSTTAYGVVPQPVITEVFAKGKRNAPGGDLTEVQAIEIYNPTNRNQTNYELRCGGSTYILPSLPAGSYTVVVNKTGSPDVDFFPEPTGGTTLEDTVVDFRNNPVELWRTADGEDIKMDTVNLDYERPDTNGETDGPKGKLRDTDDQRARYLVPRYVEYNSTSHQLGVANTDDTYGVSATDLPDVMQGFTIAVPIDGGFVHSLGELQDIFFVGPEGSTVSLPESLNDFADKVSRGKPSTENYSTAGGVYPTIPWGMMLAEFFDCVPTDPIFPNGGPNVYHWGKVNINTAPEGTLIRLPWPTFVDYDYDGVQDAGEPALNLSDSDIRALAETVVTYRQDNGPYLTPGAVQKALVEYARNNPTLMNLLEGATLEEKEKQWNYLPVVNCLYHRIANLITVRSDVFFFYIALQDAYHQKNAFQKNIFIGYIDRSVCNDTSDDPIWVISPVW